MPDRIDIPCAEPGVIFPPGVYLFRIVWWTAPLAPGGFRADVSAVLADPSLEPKEEWVVDGLTHHEIMPVDSKEPSTTTLVFVRPMLVTPTELSDGWLQIIFNPEIPAVH